MGRGSRASLRVLGTDVQKQGVHPALCYGASNFAGRGGKPSVASAVQAMLGGVRAGRTCRTRAGGCGTFVGEARRDETCRHGTQTRRHGRRELGDRGGSGQYIVSFRQQLACPVSSLRAGPCSAGGDGGEKWPDYISSARSIFSSALNFRRSAIAPLARGSSSRLETASASIRAIVRLTLEQRHELADAQSSWRLR